MRILVARTLLFTTDRSYMSPGAFGLALGGEVDKYVSAGLGDVEIIYVDRQRKNTDVGRKSTPSYDDCLSDAVYLKYKELSDAGDAPDIVVFAPCADEFSIDSDRYSVHTEWYKYIADGALADLSPMLASDESYDESSLASGVMSGGMYKGSQLFIPLFYNLPMYGGTCQRAADSGAPTAESASEPASYGTSDEFWSQVGDAARYARSQQIALFSSPLFDTEFDGCGMCPQLCTEKPLLNLPYMSIDRDNAEFRSMMRASFAARNWLAVPDEYFTVPSELAYVACGKAAMSLSLKLSSPREYIKSAIGCFFSNAQRAGTPYIDGIPAASDPEKHTALVTAAMGVSESSRSKSEAYKFIRYCMDDDDFLSSLANVCPDIGYPVKNSAAKAVIDDAEAYVNRNYQGEQTKISAAGRELYAELTENISASHPLYRPLNIIFYSSFERLCGEITLYTPDELTEQVSDEVDRGLREYLSD